MIFLSIWTRRLILMGFAVAVISEEIGKGLSAFYSLYTTSRFSLVGHHDESGDDGVDSRFRGMCSHTQDS